MNQIVTDLNSKVTEEICLAYPGIEKDGTLFTALLRTAEINGRKFIIIIDEWGTKKYDSQSAPADFREYTMPPEQAWA